MMTLCSTLITATEGNRHPKNKLRIIPQNQILIVTKRKNEIDVIAED